MWTLLLGRFADEAGREEDAGTGGVMLTTTGGDYTGLCPPPSPST